MNSSESIGPPSSLSSSSDSRQSRINTPWPDSRRTARTQCCSGRFANSGTLPLVERRPRNRSYDVVTGRGRRDRFARGGRGGDRDV